MKSLPPSEVMVLLKSFWNLVPSELCLTTLVVLYNTNFLSSNCLSDTRCTMTPFLDDLVAVPLFWIPNLRLMSFKFTQEPSLSDDRILVCLLLNFGIWIGLRDFVSGPSLTRAVRGRFMDYPWLPPTLRAGTAFLSATPSSLASFMAPSASA